MTQLRALPIRSNGTKEEKPDANYYVGEKYNNSIVHEDNCVEKAHRPFS